MYGRARPALDEVVTSVWNVPDGVNGISFLPTTGSCSGKEHDPVVGVFVLQRDRFLQIASISRRLLVWAAWH